MSRRRLHDLEDNIKEAICKLLKFQNEKRKKRGKEVFLKKKKMTEFLQTIERLRYPST